MIGWKAFSLHSVTPHVGVWIETFFVGSPKNPLLVTPHVGVWIETTGNPNVILAETVTPHVGVWIETIDFTALSEHGMSHLM